MTFLTDGFTVLISPLIDAQPTINTQPLPLPLPLLTSVRLRGAFEHWATRVRIMRGGGRGVAYYF